MNSREFFKKLDQQNKSQLERKSGLSRQAVVDAVRSKNLKLKNLERLAQHMDLKLVFEPSSSESNVLSSLEKFGAPVTSGTEGNLPLELALAYALKLSHKDGLYESLLPFVLATNANDLDLEYLTASAVLQKEAGTLGYFVSMANAFLPNQNLKTLKSYLEPFKLKVEQTLLMNEKVNFPEMFRKNKFALEWKLLVRGKFEDHLARWNKWLNFQK